MTGVPIRHIFIVISNFLGEGVALEFSFSLVGSLTLSWTLALKGPADINSKNA